MVSSILIVQSANHLVRMPAAWALVAAAYLLGSVPFGLLLARQVKGVDLRRFGSGNIGTSNAARAMGRGWGFLVFLLDFLKGLGPVMVAKSILPHDSEELALLMVVVGTAAVLGHCYSVFLRFQGGKGVATGCGVIVAIDPRVFICGGLVWLVTRIATRYAGLASIMMGLTFPVAVWFLDWMDGPEHALRRPAFFVGACLLTFLVVVRHRSNIHRMLAGTEPRVGDKVGKSPATRHHG